MGAPVLSLECGMVVSNGNHPQMANKIRYSHLLSGEWLNDNSANYHHAMVFMIFAVKSSISRFKVCGISMHFHTPCLLGEFDPLTIFREKSCCGLGHGHRKSLELASGNAMSFKWDQHLYLDYLADGIIVVSALNPYIEAHEILPFGSP